MTLTQVPLKGNPVSSAQFVSGLTTKVAIALSVVVSAIDFALLAEDGSFLLCEDGTYLLFD